MSRKILYSVISIMEKVGGWGAVTAILSALIALGCDIARSSVYALNAYRTSSAALLFFIACYLFAEEILPRIAKRRYGTTPTIQEFELLPKKAEPQHN